MKFFSLRTFCLIAALGFLALAVGIWMTDLHLSSISVKPLLIMGALFFAVLLLVIAVLLAILNRRENYISLLELLLEEIDKKAPGKPEKKNGK